MKRAALALAVAALAATPSLRAQEAPPPLKPFRPAAEEPPVKRAEPVVKPAATPAPPPGVPIVPKPAPVPAEATATPAPRAQPVVKATPAPKPPKPPNPAEMSDPTGEIRLSPGARMTADQAQLALADLHYSKREYQRAAPEYEKYLELYPTAADRQTALFRLAECYRLNGVPNAARDIYSQLLDQYMNGDFVGAAAYRMGELYYADKNYASALPQYRKASVRLKDPKLANAAKFYTGRSLEGVGDKTAAREIYRDLALSAQDNPFNEASRHALAIMLHDAGQTAEALKHLEVLEKQTQNPDVKIEAAVRTGLWLVELEQNEKAEGKLQEAVAQPNLGKWQDVALLGLLQIKYNTERFAEIIEAFKSGGTKELSADVRPQILLLVGQSHRRLGQHAEARIMFDQVMADFPNSVYAREAQGERLKSLYYTDNSKLVEEIDKYLLAVPEAQKRDEIQLMKAEVLFKKQRYAEAAPIYDILSRSKQLTGNFKAEALSKGGYCYNQTKEHDRAVKAYTALLDGFPTFKGLAGALVQRAVALLKLGQLPQAIADLERLIAKFPQAKEREKAIHQKAIIHGQQNDNEGMVAAYRLLLGEYPETPVKGEATYFIGLGEYEKKNYAEAIKYLRQARELDREQYFEKASQAVMVSSYNLEDVDGLAREVEFYTANGGKAPVRYELIHWIAQTSFDAATNAAKPLPAEARGDRLGVAARHFAILRARGDAQSLDLLTLGRAQLELGKFPEAAEAFTAYLPHAKDPAPRANGLIFLGAAQLGAGDHASADKSADEALKLQTDGEWNARARTLRGDIEAARGHWVEAAKIYESVSVVIDDERITPEALQKAIEAYKKATQQKEADRLLNTLKSRYPEFLRKK